jgi:hypothetical protein
MIPGMSGHVAGPPAYAMVGMAAVLAGSARAPLTSILLMFELTRDYRIVLPLMAAVGLSVWLVDLVNRRSTHSLNLQQMGVDVTVNQPPEPIEPLQDLEESFGDCLVNGVLSCKIYPDEYHNDEYNGDCQESKDIPVLAMKNGHLKEDVKPLPETKS